MLHPHQHDYLVAELRKPEYTDAEAAFEKLHRPPKSFLAVSFLSQSKFDAKHPKLRKGMLAVSDDYAARFTNTIEVVNPKTGEKETRTVFTGVPGMPNLIRREDFDAAWNAR